MTDSQSPIGIPDDLPYAPPAPVGKGFTIPHGRAFRPADATDAPELPETMLAPDPDIIYPPYESSVPPVYVPVMVEEATGRQQAATAFGIVGLVLGSVAVPFVFVYFFVAMFTGFDEMTWIAILGVLLPLALSILGLVLNKPRNTAATAIGVIGAILAATELIAILAGLSSHTGY